MDTGYENTQYCANVSYFSWDNWFGRCAGLSDAEWKQRAQFQPPPVGAPPVSVWTTPPANGQDAQNVVDQTIQQQMVDWQNSNASYVQPVNTWVPDWLNNLFTGNVYNNNNNGSNGWLWALGALGVVGVVSLLSQGTPGRYGR